MFCLHAPIWRLIDSCNARQQQSNQRIQGQVLILQGLHRAPAEIGVHARCMQDQAEGTIWQRRHHIQLGSQSHLLMAQTQVGAGPRAWEPLVYRNEDFPALERPALLGA